MPPTSPPLTEREIALVIGDDGSRTVMAACVRQARSAKDICAATGIPLTTVYRQIHRLESLGVLVVERSAMTSDGRKYDLYRSRVREAHLDVDEDGSRVRWELNAPVEERLAAMWNDMRWSVEPRAAAEPASRGMARPRPPSNPYLS